MPGSRRAAVLVVAVALVVLPGCGDAGGSEDDPASIAGVQEFDGLERTHVEGRVDYAQDPPVGGPHNPIWQTCGVYAAPVADEHAVHSMEHGAVWITHHPDLPAEQVEAITALAEEEALVLVSPYPGLDDPVVASAWERQLRLASGDEPALAEFVEAFAGGPQTPEPDAPCEGGIG